LQEVEVPPVAIASASAITVGWRVKLNWRSNKLNNSKTAMATLQIENLPDELYSRIQYLASEKNLTLNEAVIRLLKQSFEYEKVTIDRAQESKPMSAILQRIRSRPRVNPRDFGLMDSTILIGEDRNR
jgi:hypothetical protein